MHGCNNVPPQTVGENVFSEVYHYPASELFLSSLLIHFESTVAETYLYSFYL